MKFSGKIDQVRVNGGSYYEYPGQSWVPNYYITLGGYQVFVEVVYWGLSRTFKKKQIGH